MRLRNLLLRWLLLPTLAVSALGFAVGYTRSLAQANEAYDRTLLGAALVIGERLMVTDGSVVADLPQAALEMLRTDAQDRIFYRVADVHDGHYVTGYEDLPVPDRVPPTTEPVFYDAVYKEQAVRVVAVTHAVLGGSKQHRVLVQVAETQDARHQLTRRIVSEAAAVQLMLIALAAALIALGVRRGLAPLARLRAEVRGRPTDDLTPIDVHSVPREVVPLIEAINTHTERQRQLSEAQVRFVANASHQLKTPLTVLRAQIGHALMQTDLPSMHALVTQLNSSSDSIGRLIEQLLALARSEPGRPLDMREIDLLALAREVTFEMVTAARHKSIDLGFEAGKSPLVRGERVLLRELIVNIVHNAVAYTQEGGTVTVSVGEREGRSVLRVVDNGPGIALTDRARALERFSRIAESSVRGSGLGLAIANEICARHDIAISLLDAPHAGRGLCVELVWPPAEAASPAAVPA